MSHFEDEELEMRIPLEMEFAGVHVEVNDGHFLFLPREEKRGENSINYLLGLLRSYTWTPRRIILHCCP